MRLSARHRHFALEAIIVVAYHCMVLFPR